MPGVFAIVPVLAFFGYIALTDIRQAKRTNPERVRSMKICYAGAIGAVVVAYAAALAGLFVVVVLAAIVGVTAVLRQIASCH